MLTKNKVLIFGLTLTYWHNWHNFKLFDIVFFVINSVKIYCITIHQLINIDIALTITHRQDFSSLITGIV